ncbi:MAG: chorismate mutase [Acidimicrobiia bacterium]
MTFLAIRGATTCSQNTKEDITSATQALVKEMIDKNSLDQSQIISILFSATRDLTKEFPATAARGLGLDDIPLMCAQELEIEGSMPRCIRVMMHVDADISRSEVSHIFLGEAKNLRKDLVKE